MPERCSQKLHRLPPLESGDHLSAREFLRRYEAMPEVKKAELINGIVYLGSPGRIDQHGEPDELIQGWLCNSSVATPGVKHATNSTTRLGPDDVPQPDGQRHIVAESGGQARVDSKGYLDGAPELVVVVAASSVSLHVRKKMASYRRSSVREYVVCRTEAEAVDWLVLEEDEFCPLAKDAAGVFRSKVFPGLWLDVPALLAGDELKVMAKLQEGLQSAERDAFIAEIQKRRQV